MAKPEIEFTDYDTGFEWKDVEGDTLGIKEKILSYDEETGDYTRMLKFPPGLETSETLVHEFWEEVLLVDIIEHMRAYKYFHDGRLYACKQHGDASFRQASEVFTQHFLARSIHFVDGYAIDNQHFQLRCGNQQFMQMLFEE